MKNQIWGDHLEKTPDTANVQFCAGRDVNAIPMADEVLLPFDIWTNLAHSIMLHQVGVLSKEELQGIQNSLTELQKKYEQGEFALDPQKEDVHINIEHFVTNDCEVSAGKKMHTGRSRNDQVSTDMRLYMRNEVLVSAQKLMKLIESILNKAKEELHSYMPGFTHYQPAMITTFAHWMTNWSQGLLRDLTRLKNDFEFLNYSPLGAAASFGTSWKINRETTAELLGFEGVEENTLDCISSRWENEAQLTSTFSFMMNHLATVAQDLMLLNLPYYDMIDIDDQFVTGSSIMPQKRNLDFAEIIRSKASMAHGIWVSLMGIQKGSMSGYNRDSQQTKYLIMDLFRECADAPLILSGVIDTLVAKREEMQHKCEFGFMNSADVADWLAQKYSLAFRDCYNLLALAVKYSRSEGKLTLSAMEQSIQERGLDITITQEDLDLLNSPKDLISEKKHTGSPSADSVQKMIDKQTQKLSSLSSFFEEAGKNIQSAQEKCFAWKAE
ncbi:MAG: argininosuccinate lyase [bacterium]